MYPAVYRTNERVVFLYLCEDAQKKIFVACPYSHRDLTNGSKIPCATVNITNALKEGDPVKVMEEIKKIITDDAKWVMHGDVNDFSISVPGRRMFWGEIEECCDIRLTDNNRIKLIMMLDVMA